MAFESLFEKKQKYILIEYVHGFCYNLQLIIARTKLSHNSKVGLMNMLVAMFANKRMHCTYS